MKTKRTVVKHFDKGPIVKYTYDNGAVYLYHSYPGISRVCFSITFIVGSINEKDNEHGLAHLLEHLIFKSARHNQEGNLIDQLEQLGAEINAYTSKDHTCFELMCNHRSFKSILPLFLKIFGPLNVSEKEFNKEKKVVLHEIREDLNDPDVFSEEKLIEVNFQNEFSHPIGGSVKTVKSLTLKQARNFYKKYYSSNRMIVNLVASDEHRFVKNELVKFFNERKELKSKTLYRFKIKDSFKRVNHINKTYIKKIETPLLTIGFSAPALNSKHRAALVIIDQILNDGLSSLFFKATRESVALSYGIDTSINSFFDCGHYLVSMNTNKALLDKAEKAIFKTIFITLPSVLTDELLTIEKRKLQDYWDLNFDDADERLEYILKLELYGRLNIKMNDIENLIRDITVKDLVEYIELMKGKGFSKIVVIPK